MPCLIPYLINLLISALRLRTYPNVYRSIGQTSFYFYCPRKGSKDFTPENIKVFKDWDFKKGRKFVYSKSRQRLLAALKRSVYLTLVSSTKNLYEFRFNSPEEIGAKRLALRQNKGSGNYGSDGESMPPSSPDLSPSRFDEFSNYSVLDSTLQEMELSGQLPVLCPDVPDQSPSVFQDESFVPMPSSEGHSSFSPSPFSETTDLPPSPFNEFPKDSTLSEMELSGQLPVLFPDVPDMSFSVFPDESFVPMPSSEGHSSFSPSPFPETTDLPPSPFNEFPKDSTLSEMELSGQLPVLFPDVPDMSFSVFQDESFVPMPSSEGHSSFSPSPFLETTGNFNSCSPYSAETVDLGVEQPVPVCMENRSSLMETCAEPVVTKEEYEFTTYEFKELCLGDELKDVTSGVPMNEADSDMDHLQTFATSGVEEEIVPPGSNEHVASGTAIQPNRDAPIGSLTGDAVQLRIEEVVTSGGDAAYLISASMVFGIPH